MRLAVALIFVCGSVWAQATIENYEFVGSRGGHSYYYSTDNPSTWMEAKLRCNSLGGYLWCIDSQEENDFVYSQGINEIWIGLSDRVVEGSWIWESGESLVYSRWEPGQPDNAGGNQDCGALWPSGHWDDDFCNSLRRHVMEIPTLLSCAPTSIPFIDNFDSPDLDSCWSWVREDSSHWSLTERQGWMRITTQTYTGFSRANILWRKVNDENLSVECKLEVEPFPNNWALLEVYQDDFNSVNIVKQADGHIRAHNWIDGEASYFDLEETWNPVYFRIDKIGQLYMTKASPDGVNWQFIQSWTRDLTTDNGLRVGVNATIWPSGSSTSVDFDDFRVDSLPGTNTCGNVSGVWDSTGSPYYVTCDVTVPVGQTLEIQPGVEVLFTGHYKFNVFGNLQAIGTEQDSIVFTRAFPTEESKWNGITIRNAQDTCRMHYCVIEQAHHSEYFFAGGGGGLFIESSAFELENSTVQNNWINDDGGGARINYVPYGRIINCLFRGNFDQDVGGLIGGGGIQASENNNFVISHSVFAENHSNGNGGGVGLHFSGDMRVVNCTFVGNTCGGNGSAIYSDGQNGPLINCIVKDNTGPGQQVYAAAQPLSATYSNIQGGYPGTGNIDADPVFVYEANADFNLQAGSPCIDTGDPTSPLDPDGSRADMGAFRFMHCLHTELPIIDNFDSPELDSCWYWIREDSSQWSLSQRQGWLRILSDTGHSWNDYCCWENLPLLTVSSQSIIVSTKLAFSPVQDNQEAGLIFFDDDDHYVRIARTHHSSLGGQAIFMDSEDGQGAIPFQSAIFLDTLTYLQIRVIDNSFWGAYSSDSLTWHYFGPFSNSLTLRDQYRVGVFATNGSQDIASIPADFEYFRVNALPGTNVCGDISGVWDSSGSPYYVSCDVTVPVGQNLEIQPGVQVLFGGRYSIRVEGIIKASGSVTDSIYFGPALPLQASRGKGIRIFDATDSCLFQYCIIDSCYFDEPTFESEAGGIYVRNSRLTVRNSVFKNNWSFDDGGGLKANYMPYLAVVNCSFVGNHANDIGGNVAGAGLMVHDSDSLVVNGCLFVGNSTPGNGSAIALQNMSDASLVLLRNCTIVANISTGSGPAIKINDGLPTIANCIVRGNQAGTLPIIVPSPESTVTFSNIDSDYIGIGNINADPLFVDAANGNFNLLVDSPCIDAGDPNSPLDPDGSRADMGAFPFFNPPLCGSISGAWTLAMSPIYVDCDLLVSAGQSLAIDAGVEVIFKGPYSLSVNGSLACEGTGDQPVIFRPDTTAYLNNN